MAWMDTGSYFLKKAFQSMRRSLFLNLVAVGIIATCLFIFSSLVLTWANAQGFLGSWGRGVSVVGFLREGISAEELARLKASLKGMKEVDSFRHLSKEEALSSFRKELAQDEDIIFGLPGNPLPASLEIRVREGYLSEDKIALLVGKLKSFTAFEEVRYSPEWVKRFGALLSLLRTAGALIAALVLTGTVLIVTSTIKLAAYARREEIEIMKLVGATNMFIRAPFLVEGMAQGLAGAALSLASLYLSYHLVTWALSAVLYPGFGMPSLVFLSAYQWSAILIGGTFLGVLGSSLSLGRFLRE